jgi:putative spermidine/putrescine transport system permease protein
MRCFNSGLRGGSGDNHRPDGQVNRSRRLKLRVFRVVVFLVMGAFFLTPFGAMFEFSTRGNGVDAPRTWESWTTIATYPTLVQAIVASLELAAITSVAMLLLLLPTMIWVRLRLPRLNRVIEFLCLLPLTIPAIVLVVGLSPVYLWMANNISDSILTLSFAYVILVLPYAYRALDAGLSAIDVKTLSEAARSLGAGWTTVILRVIAPNMSAALLNASLLSVALVLGEFTFANLLGYVNLQVEINQLGQANAGVSIAVSVASLLFAFVLLMVLSFVGAARRSLRSKTRAVDPRLEAVWGQKA